MGWKRMEIQEQRMQFVIRALSGCESMTTLCREYGISRPTGYLWKRRYEQARSFSQLVERSRRPGRSPNKTPDWQEMRVVLLREQTGWGAKKLQVLLRDEQQLHLPVRTIHRILERRELLTEGTHAPALQRFQRSQPNELWQMDTKGQYPLVQGECHPLSILDDHSRFLVGLYALSELSTEQAYPCIVQSFHRYGVPEAMLMDRGPLWWSASNGWGLTWLSVRLIEQGIRLLYGRVCHPQTQGKVERSQRTTGEELRHRGVPEHFAEWPSALASIEQSYNQRRPHEALGMRRPAEVYRPSAKGYRAQPEEWVYPSGSEVVRLNTQGSWVQGKRRWFVCESLAGARVRIERCDGKQLVSYRHMYIRELDLVSGKSKALVAARTTATGECTATVASEATSTAHSPAQPSFPPGSKM
jgi:transposase InsO family protein